MRKALCIFLVLALYMAYACGKKPESAANVEVIDGIEHIRNTSTPLHPDKTVAFVEDLLPIKMQKNSWPGMREVAARA